MREATVLESLWEVSSQEIRVDQQGMGPLLPTNGL